MEKKCTAIVLAAGQGKRMQSREKKQFMLLNKRPVLYYSLAAFEKSQIINDIILVTDASEIAYCKEQIVDHYKFRKVKAVIAGGKERYDSVFEGLGVCLDTDIVFIHDSARPMIDEEMIRRGYEDVLKYDASIAAVPAKDTIKLGNDEGCVVETIDRSHAWIIQTPQIFSYKLIYHAYCKAKESGMDGITDDAMIAERFTDRKVHLFMGGYNNLKITTPEDLPIAELIVSKNEKT